MRRIKTAVVMGIVIGAAWLCPGVDIGETQKSPKVFAIVVDGKPASTIVVPDVALPVVTAAVQELQYHIQESTGACVPVVKENHKPVGAGLIYVGLCQKTIEVGIEPQKFPPNGCVIKVVNNNLYLVGNDTVGPVFGTLINNYTRVGTLFAVYDFLENEMDVHWLWPGKLGEMIPKRSELVIKAESRSWAPNFIRSRFRDIPAGYEVENAWARAEHRTEFYNNQSVWLRRQRFAMGADVNIGHAFSDYWDRFSGTHGEFFALMPDGTRRPDPAWNNDPKLIAMCVSQPKLWKQIIEDWQKTRTPLRPQINVCENDCCGKCVCEKCLSWDALDPHSELPIGAKSLDFPNRVAKMKEAWENGKEIVERREAASWLGSLSDRYAKFYMAVQNEASKVDPNVVVCAWAYANYSRAPIHTKLNDRVYIGIVPVILFPWTDKLVKDFKEQWDGWSAAGAKLFLRPNYTIDGHNMPIFYARKFGECFKYAAQRGLIATDFDSITGQWAAQGPNLYVVGRMNVHPDWSVDKVLDEYYAGFGPSKSAVRLYFEFWETVSDSVTEEFYYKQNNGGWNRFYGMARAIFTPEVMAKGAMLLKKARLAAGGNAIAQRRVDFLEKGLQHANLTLATSDAYNMQLKTKKSQEFITAFQKLHDYRDSIENENISNMGFITLYEDKRWDRKLLKSASKSK